GTSLPYKEREFAIQLTLDHFISDIGNSGGNFFRQPSVSFINQRCGLLYISIGVIHLLWHMIISNRKMKEASLCLCPPVMLCRHCNCSHRIALNSITGGLCPDGNGLKRFFLFFDRSYRGCLLFTRRDCFFRVHIF